MMSCWVSLSCCLSSIAILESEFVSQVNSTGKRARSNLIRRAGFNYLAVVQYKCLVTCPQGFPDIVIGDQNADVAFLQMGDDFFDVDHRQRIDAGKGFVQQHEGRVRCQGPGDLQAPAFAPGKHRCSGFRHVGDAQFFQQASSAVVALLAGQGQRFQYCQNILADGQLPENGCPPGAGTQPPFAPGYAWGNP